jgi:hypothetical protein
VGDGEGGIALLSSSFSTIGSVGASVVTGVGSQVLVPVSLSSVLLLSSLSSSLVVLEDVGVSVVMTTTASVGANVGSLVSSTSSLLLVSSPQSSPVVPSLVVLLLYHDNATRRIIHGGEGNDRGVVVRIG